MSTMKSIYEDIKKGTFKRFYLLYGEERYLRNLYRDKLKEAIGAADMNLSSYMGKGVNIREIIDLCETMPFLSDYRLIIMEDTRFAKDSCEELAEYIPNIPETTVIVMSEAEVDKRSKVYKAAEKAGGAIAFEKQDEKTLTTWILSRCKKEGKQITSGAVKELFTMCGYDMVGLSTELEKLFCYTYDKEGIAAEDVRAICSKLTEANIFDMIEHVSRAKLKEALELYYEMLAAKESAMRILRLLCRQFNQLLQVKLLSEEGNSDSGISGKLKLSPRVVGKLKDQGRRFTKQVLTEAVEECVELEEAVKTGKLDENLSVELIIMKYGMQIS